MAKKPAPSRAQQSHAIRGQVKTPADQFPDNAPKPRPIKRPAGINKPDLSSFFFAMIYQGIKTLYN